MNVVSSSGDVLHHHPLALSVGGTDEEVDIDPTISPGDEEGRASRRRPTRGQSRIEFERLAAFFHVPINEAAKGLGVCATVLKKVCRKHGIPRWPHRKIKKLDTMLAMLETAANKPGNPQHDDDVRKKMDAVMRDRAVLMTEGKLVGEGKSENRRKSDGKGRDKKRKKPDDEESDDPNSDSLNSSYSLSHSGSDDLLQNQMVIAPPISNLGHMPSMDLASLPYHMAGYQSGSYAYSGSSSGLGQNGLLSGSSSYPYGSLFWNGNTMGMNGVSLPSVHSISSGVISSTTGMMMHNLPPPMLSHSSLPMAPPTPISPLTSMAPPLSSSSNPLPVLPPHLHNKHPKLSHSDMLLNDHAHHHSSSYSSSSYGYHHPPSRSHSSPSHLSYSEYSVQHEPENPSSHFRLFQEVPIHANAAE